MPRASAHLSWIPPMPELVHPVPLAAVALLALNDHLLKRAWPGLITGKLSDVAGCFVLPLFVSALLSFAARGQLGRRLAIGTAVTALLFCAVKLSPQAGAAVASALGWAGGPLGLGSQRIVADPSDLLALPAAAAAVLAFTVLPSNIGILEGGLDAETNARQRKGILALAEQRHGGPVVEVEPVVLPVPEVSTPRRPRERLPWMACLARITSAPIDPYMVSSELTLVWWLDALELPLSQEIERAVEGIDWARSARDVDLP